MFDYFTVDEIAKFTFYRIPKLLITDEKFKSLSCEAKLLYGLLLDRAALSKSKKWIDADGKIYVYFRQEEVQEMLNIASGKAVKIFKELDTFGLIVRVKQGQGKPTKIYVMNFSQTVAEDQVNNDVLQTCDDCGETQVKTCENRKSEKLNGETQVKTCENRKSKLPKNESLPFIIGSKTEMSNIYSSSEGDDEKRKSENSSRNHIRREDMLREVENVKQQISYSEIRRKPPMLDEMINIMAWVYSTSEPDIPVSGVLIDTHLVIERLKQITQKQIRQLADDLKIDSSIKSPRNYLLTCLYNAPIKASGDSHSSFDVYDLEDLGVLCD